MTAFLGWGRSSSFVPVRPQGPKKPRERDEHEHNLAKVSERHVHRNPPLSEGRNSLVAIPQKNFVLGLWRTTPPLTGGLTAYRFLADSHVVSHARPS